MTETPPDPFAGIRHNLMTLNWVIALLAVVTLAGFGFLGTQMGRLDGRIDRLDGRIDRLDAKIDAGFARLDGRIDRLDAKIDALNARLDAAFHLPPGKS
jgi:outer membrane murein-binding lipoprotein Lpp